MEFALLRAKSDTFLHNAQKPLEIDTTFVLSCFPGMYRMEESSTMTSFQHQQSTSSSQNHSQSQAQALLPPRTNSNHALPAPAPTSSEHHPGSSSANNPLRPIIPIQPQQMQITM